LNVGAEPLDLSGKRATTKELAAFADTLPMSRGIATDALMLRMTRQFPVSRLPMDRAFPRAGCRALIFVALALAAGPSAAQTLTDRLVIHGYLTQGYATTNSYPIMGIPNDGTFDYRRVALLLRFKGTPKDAFVVQIANRHLGESPINAFTPDVQLDWAFYERKLGMNTTLRLGKEPIPMGIFNERRFVGTLLPFYRAPFGFYQEGAFTSETLNGAVLTRQLNPGSKWLVTGSVFAGEFDYLQAAATVATDSAPSEYVVAPALARNLLGAQFWMQTPITGLRVGAGAARRKDKGLFRNQVSGRGSTIDLWTSVDGSFERFTTRAEFRRISYGRGGNAFRTYYGQVGYQITDALVVNVQRDVMDLTIPLPSGALEIPYNQDNGIGLAYTFGPNIVGKLEYHDSDGYGVEAPVDFGGDAIQSRYIITSISVAF
jgi:hypothetical protein